MFKALATLLSLVCIHPVLAGLPTIASFTQHFDSRPGFVPIYYDADNGKVYLQITTPGQEILFQSSLPRGIGSNDIGLDRGQLGDTRLVRFERFGKNLLLKQLNTQYRAVSDNRAEKQSIEQAFADSVIAGLPIVAQEGQSLLVDYTDFMLSDIHGISQRLAATKQGKYKIDKGRSGIYLPRTKAFADNTEIEALVTFAGVKPGKFVRQVTPAPESISVHLHHSFVRLPDDEYQPRAFHPYSGFWKRSYQDYAVPIEQNMEQKFIPRHRLAKRNPAAEVSEAIEPIVYYMDPGIPEPVMSALQEGALWWDQAFAAIGYKNAFQIKVLPEGADPMDVRYNLIQWVHRATRGWSYGGSVIDPRTGEIIKGHVTLGSLRVRQDYLIALGLTSPFTGDDPDTSAQQQMALNRIKQLSAHEVGHTLGIAHNFAASANKRASVMDYPHPRLFVRDGQVVLSEAYAQGIGEWDKHVIAYGYQDLPPEVDESAYLAKVIARAHQQGFAYQSDPDARALGAANAQGHLWDDGADPLQALNNINQVRAVALGQFGLHSLPEGEALSSLQERLAPIYLMHRYQLQAVAKLVAGRQYQYEVKNSAVKPQGMTEVAPARQHQALQAVLNTMSDDYLQLPEPLLALLIPKVYGDSLNRESFSGQTGVAFDYVSAAESSAAFGLSLLLEATRVNRLAQQTSSGQQLTLAEMLATIQDTLVKKGFGESLIAKRVAYMTLDAFVKALTNPHIVPEARAEFMAQLKGLTRWLKKRRGSDQQTMGSWLQHYWQTGQWLGEVQTQPLPPGSPI